VPWRRSVIIATAAVALIVIIAVVVALGRIDAIVKREIEARGSAITQTAVQVGSVDVSLHNGTATLRDLTVANPPGFTAPYAFELGEITVHIAVGSVASDPLVIREIRIAAPRVTCELDASGTSNVEILRRAVEAAERRDPHDTPPAPAPGEGRPRAPKRQQRLIIDVLALRDGEVYVDARAVGGPEERERLPGFELTDIGTKQGGATPAEVGRIVITALARDVAVAVAATQLERYIGQQGSEWLKKGGAEVIRKGLGDVLDQILR
jgi:uncharacterized protein involved in outer membrane biogenesis